MPDARRRRWVAHDVYFLDGVLGQELFDRFGAAGVALWHGFIAACKKNHVEGQTTYASEPEALVIFGLPGMPLLDLDGEPFTLDDFFDVLGAHKVTRRTKRARRVKVVCSRWEEWQNPRNTRPAGGRQMVGSSSADAPQMVDSLSGDDQQPDDSRTSGSRNRRSDGENATTNGANPDREIPADTDLDTDTDKPPSGVSSRTRSDRATRLPDGWIPAAEEALQAQAVAAGVDLRREFDRFRDYWRAKGGQGGRKTDWQATWRNWVRRAIDDRGGTSPPQLANVHQLAAGEGGRF